MTDVATTDQSTAGRTRPGRTDREHAQELDLERYRVELTGYCYRMLGSAFEAEDAVQDTMVRAWRSLDRFDGQALRPWLYRIATNVCLTMLSRRQRRPRPVDTSPGGGRQADGAADRPWVWPAPDELVVPGDADPADMAVARDTVRLAFVAALQLLRPRPRAVLILHDVLRWRAREIAELLDTSVASVTSSLQRARATLAAHRARTGEPPTLDAADPGDEEQQELLDRYVTAFERFDIESLVTLLHSDATMTMPPLPLWLEGRLEICRFLLQEAECRGSRMVPTVANGSPAFGVYRPTGPDGSYEPFAVQVVEVAAGRIAGMHTFVDPALVRLFGLPAHPLQPVA